MRAQGQALLTVCVVSIAGASCNGGNDQVPALSGIAPSEAVASDAAASRGTGSTGAGGAAAVSSSGAPGTDGGSAAGGAAGVGAGGATASSDPAGNAGAAGAPSTEREIALADAPQPVQDTVATERGGADVEEVVRIQDGDSISYEITADLDGWELMMTIAEDGTLLFKEQAVDPAGLPTAVAATVNSNLGGADDYEVWLVTESGQTAYQVYAVTAAGEQLEFRVAKDGNLLD